MPLNVFFKYIFCLDRGDENGKFAHRPDIGKIFVINKISINYLTD